MSYHDDLGLTPGRKGILREIVNYLGQDNVISSSDDWLVGAVYVITKETEKHTKHPTLDLNEGALTGLRLGQNSLLDANKLTPAGVMALRMIARETE